jgi:GalNAc-alpha-(1->4)-GalNAc-alpha-(1->3)-diNAcBac-PP-undecaprenol alpha-1,4-N-acetyl-D-galactosaminyltransferase
LALKYHVYVADRSSPAKSIGKVHNILRNLLYKQAAGLIVQTHDAAQIACRYKRNMNIKIIGNPVEKKETNTVERENIILTVGRLVKTKNIDRLIKIFSKVNSEHKWKLVIVGDDAQGQHNLNILKKLSYDLGMSNYIKFEGFKRNVDQYYGKSKIFAFASSSEGFPNVIGEALSSGLPVVSYNCVAGPSEMINDGANGFLVPVYDDEMFAEKLQFLMHNKDIRSCMSSEAIKLIDKFDSRIVSEQFYDFITNENN